MSSAPEINFFDPELARDASALFQRLQDERPAYWSSQLHGWVITRHADCVALLRDRRLSSARMPRLFAMLYGQTPIDPASVTYEHHTRTMLFADGAEHTRLRSTMARAFTPRALAAYREPLARVVARRLDAIAGAGRCDAQAEYARPLAGAMIDELMGVPESDRPQVNAWTQTAIGFLRGAAGGAALVAAVEDTLRSFVAYVEGLIAERRARPREDLISFLIEGHEQGLLSDWELAHQIVQLTAAGRFTIDETIGMTIATLLQDPAAPGRLRAAPELWPNAIEECTRYTTPTQAIHRVVAEPVELHGSTLAPGDLLYLFLGPANRDPRVFADPHVLDIARAEASRHIAYAGGPHFCLGATLARMELETAVRAIFERFPTLRLERPPETLQAGVFVRALQSLPLAWD